MAYKEGKSWTAQYYAHSISGKSKQVKKRGFPTKRAAMEFEMQQKLKQSGVIDMKLRTFVDKYFEDKKSELKERTMRNKKYLMDQYIVPYFGEMKLTDITAAHILEWQNEISTKGFSESYLRMIQNQLTALFTHAVRIYNLDVNPVKKVRRMGKADKRSINFWTLEEYQKFIGTFGHEDKYYVLFEILFWTGCREGEVLALTPADVNFKTNQINIDKTFYRSNGVDVITEPKTEESIRTIEIPQFLADKISGYINRHYSLPDNERLFPVGHEAVQHKMKHNIRLAGVKKIRVHDLRHSHAAYLINRGVQPLIIKERLGHKDIRITLNTYGHLYPSEQKKVADLLDMEVQRLQINDSKHCEKHC